MASAPGFPPKLVSLQAGRKLEASLSAPGSVGPARTGSVGVVSVAAERIVIVVVVVQKTNVSVAAVVHGGDARVVVMTVVAVVVVQRADAWVV